MSLPPVLVINLDRSPDRWERIQKDLVGLAPEVIRVPAIDGRSISFEDTKVFHDTMRGNILRDQDENPPDQWVLGNATSAGCATEATFRVQQPRLANVLGCFLSHARAIETGLELGLDRFLILEDDAVPRADIIEATPDPDTEGIYVWGGAIPMSSTRVDAMKYWTRGPWDKSDWITVDRTPKGLRRRYGAQAYEITPSVAPRFLELYLDPAHRAPADCTWHYAMLEIPTYRLDPCAFGQNKDYEPSTIGRDRPGPPVEKWIRTGVKPEDFDLVTADKDKKAIWKGLY